MPFAASRMISGMSLRVLRAIRADDAELAPHEPGDLDRRRGFAGCDADRDHAAAVANHFERLRKCLRQSEDFERHVDATAVRQLANACGCISCGRVDHIGGAKTARRLELVVLDVHRDDL